MTTSPGVSVIIPTGGQRRLHLLDGTLAGLRVCQGITQIIVAESGRAPFATMIARRWQADYIFSEDKGKFNKSRAINLGSALAHQDVLAWCDGDILFRPDFMLKAREELLRRELDFLQPFAAIRYLSERDTSRILQGRLAPEQCHPVHEWRYPPAGICLVRASFLRRHGGLHEAFSGWGAEDEAWIHKVGLLGRMAWTDQDDRHVWHLFHPEAARDKSNFQNNLAVFYEMTAISCPAAYRRAYPPPRHATVPWRDMTRVAFLALSSRSDSPARQLAMAWASRMQGLYGVAPAIVTGDVANRFASSVPAAELLVLFADDAVEGRALQQQLGKQPCICVAMDSRATHPSAQLDTGCHWVLPRTAAQAAQWSAADAQTWHRPWWPDPVGTPPVLVQLISHVLGQSKRWSVRIEVDRAAMPPEALDRSPFWYVSLHDDEGAEIARQDASSLEVLQLARQPGQVLELKRIVEAARPPARWTVWPVDRHRRWLQPVHGQIAAAPLLAIAG